MPPDTSLEKARASGLRLVKFRPRSESEFRQRLSRKGFGSETVLAVVEEFKRRDLLNDEKFARLFASHQMAHKPMGRAGLLTLLKAKGVEGGLAGAAVSQAAGEEDEFALARELAAKRVAATRGVKPDALKRRLFGFLSRRGFSSEVVYKVLREVSIEER
ncbi:MAG: regulatory protein RecX [Candidatus Omnitrophica bacterium]|nr:regulatory protein RecX [Candidatus Omnitrophota bacterium]